MKVILDSNILISAFLSYGTPNIIYEAWREKRFDLVTCSFQIEELRRISRYEKFKIILPHHRMGQLLNNMQHAVVIERLSDDFEAYDPHDSWLLALADKSQAHYLVTGDKRAELLSKKRIGPTAIVSAHQFVKTAL
jgi:putative PIN family toxin of toxin-antitoxin system